MNRRRLVLQTLDFAGPPRIPRQAWILPWAEQKYPEATAELMQRFPDDIVPAPAVYTRPVSVQGDRYARGEHMDEWGCRFSNPQEGIIGIVRKPLLKNWSELEDFKAPDAVLSLDVDAVNDFCRQTDQFVLAGTVQRPFERLGFIRTMEQAFIDLLEEPPELEHLLKQIHDHYCKEVEIWSRTDIDGVSLMDDWGTQTGLMTHPDIFRKWFKPMYREYAGIARCYGKRVFMHSDGYILPLIGDLIEAGIEALNAQIFCMGVPELGRRFRGRLTFWGEIDRQYTLAQGTTADVRDAVHQVHQHLYHDGGVIAQCEFGLEARPENVLTVFKTWDDIFAEK